jgi:hypothetical protein
MSQELDLRGVPPSVVDMLKEDMLKIQQERELQQRPEPTEPTEEQKAAQIAEMAQRVEKAVEMETAAKVAQEQKVEVPQEEMEAAANKAVEDKEEVKDWRDIIKQNEEKKRKEEEENEFRKLMEDPIVKTIYKAKKNGQNPLEVIKNIPSLNVDEVTEEQLFRMSVQGEDLTEDEIQDRFDNFMYQPESIRKAIFDSKKAELKQAQEEIYSESKEFQAIKDSGTKALAYLDDATEKLKGVEVGGVKITKALQAEIFQKATTLLPAFKQGTQFEADRALELAVRDIMYPHIVNQTAKIAESDAKRAAFKEIHNPDAKGQPIATGVASSKTDAQIQDEALNAYLERQRNPFGIKK